MQVKAFEILDKSTFIPALGISMTPDAMIEVYLLRRSGYSITDRLVLLCRMDSNGAVPHQASYDVYGWGGARTMSVAHDYIAKNWDKLRSGDVIDVEFILGETKTPKKSEREYNPHQEVAP